MIKQTIKIDQKRQTHVWYIDYKMHDFGLYALPCYKLVTFHVKQLLLNRQYIMLKIQIRQKRV